MDFALTIVPLQIIPRTSRMNSNAHIALKPEDLVSKLFPKLEEIKKKQDIEDLFTKKMHEVSFLVESFLHWDHFLIQLSSPEWKRSHVHGG